MKACFSCTLFRTNIKWTDMGSNLGFRDEGSATLSKTTGEREREREREIQRATVATQRGGGGMAFSYLVSL